MTRTTGYKVLACRFCNKNEARVSADCIALTCWECITNGVSAETSKGSPDRIDRLQGKSVLSEAKSTDQPSRKPVTVKLAGQEITVKSWIESLKAILNHLATLNPEKFKTFEQVMPSYVGSEPSKFRRPLPLEKGFYCESNVSSGTIRSIVERARTYFSLEEQHCKIVTS